MLPSLEICMEPKVNDKTPALPVDKVKPFLLGTTNVSPDLINLVKYEFPSRSSISTQLLPDDFKTISSLGILSLAIADVSLLSTVTSIFEVSLVISESIKLFDSTFLFSLTLLTFLLKFSLLTVFDVTSLFTVILSLLILSVLSNGLFNLSSI